MSISGRFWVSPEDSEILRLEQIVRSGIEPRVPGIRFHPVSAFSLGPVLIVRVPRSWALPHGVLIKGGYRFYGRGERGNYPMQVPEIRAAFMASESIIDRIRRLRVDRLSAILAGETPVRLIAGATVLLQVVPYSALNPTNLDRPDIEKFRGNVLPIGAGGSWRYNFDGIMISVTERSGACSGYLQVYRNGILEAVNRTLIHVGESEDRPTWARDYIPTGRLEDDLVDAVGRYLKALASAGLVPPAFILLSMVGVRGLTLAVENGLSSTPIDSDPLLFPEVVVESLAEDVRTLLHPVFDALWQAGGFPRCPRYPE